ncbi:tRNA1(Val) (adenine(37)-N6)-methyltransferase [Vibrio rarus]|uniref:tRNA1(Val) (adenine(37)-N6)-methyltransferase n=1 Tax=Vibrio rarus TaxID=413403 RepID=UPI0021C42C73|nr:methyltransferase [Vibrio rarus]
MSNTTKNFQFKSFSIWGGNSGMPVSTDGVLLGAWSNIACSKKLIDIGTGTGLLSLMCAQRNPDIKITAIDIDEAAIASAHRNFAHSPWANRITLKHADVLEYAQNNPHLFDTIICNPPYFNSGEQASASQRAVARHTDNLPHLELLDCCEQLLTSTGKGSFILPTQEAEQFIDAATERHWQLTRLCKIKTTAKKNHSRYLFELQRTESKLPEMEPSELIIQQNGRYTAQFIALTQSFYLKM